jgi:GAF domain-containing protein
MIVEAALSEIDGAEHASISLNAAGKVTTPAATSRLVHQVDALQYEVNEGPCLSSLREEQTVRSDDLTEETRWPTFAAKAVDHGIRSMLAVQLFVRDDNLGALNLYAESPNSFDRSDENIALLLASHAAVALVDTREIEHLTLALDNRDIIGQAKGILMERYKVSAKQAFGMLVTVSQHKHIKLSVVAERLATTGELPELRM